MKLTSCVCGRKKDVYMDGGVLFASRIFIKFEIILYERLCVYGVLVDQ